MNGISVIVCCYNSEKLLTNTLNHLINQKLAQAFGYEIIIVNNNSSDNTVITANAILSSSPIPIDFSIINESNPGLAHARKTGVQKAKFTYVLFCDDDNWLAPDYIGLAYNTMEADAKLAAVGGLGTPVFETSKPEWFDTYAFAYATGTQEGNLSIHLLFGAGIVIRKQILIDLFKVNFESILTGRIKGKLQSGDDAEYTILFKILGYKLNYLPELSFNHFLTKERLEYSYLKRIFNGFGNSAPLLDCYKNILDKSKIPPTLQWLKLFLKSIFRTVYWFIVAPGKRNRVIYLLWNLSYLSSCWKLRTSYKQKYYRIIKIIDNYHALNKAVEIKN